jgi:hypothetical protein
MNFKITMKVFHACERKATQNSGSSFIVKDRQQTFDMKRRKVISNWKVYSNVSNIRDVTLRYVTSPCLQRKNNNVFFFCC